MALMTTHETGITCEADGCGGEFGLGEEYLWWFGKKLHQRCASNDAAGRRERQDEPLAAAQRILAESARVVLDRAQLRALVALAAAKGLEPVRKPDSGRGRQLWYGRMPGWSASRVHAGLAASEVAGMWLDFLDAGRVPPLRRSDLSVIMDVIDAPASIVTSP